MKSRDELAAWASAAPGAVRLEAAVAELQAALPAYPERDFWLARKGGLLALLNDHWLKPAAPADKPALGQALNQLKRRAEEFFALQQRSAAALTVELRLQSERVDVTLPGRIVAAAPAHPVLQVRDEVVNIFLRLGYSVADGPEIESTYYNFEALNIPEGHPAREEQDTLYLGPGLDGMVLRTHTS
ncbi:MAG: phenylalanine--tRNA ligase subunit alpha, partial [Terriglobales bacterium]